MALEVWYPQDVINILRALDSAGELQPEGYHKALNDVALAFGIKKLSVGNILPWRVIDAEYTEEAPP
jgi:hypothetical protein